MLASQLVFLTSLGPAHLEQRTSVPLPHQPFLVVPIGDQNNCTYKHSDSARSKAEAARREADAAHNAREEALVSRASWGGALGAQGGGMNSFSGYACLTIPGYTGFCIGYSSEHPSLHAVGGGLCPLALATSPAARKSCTLTDSPCAPATHTGQGARRHGEQPPERRRRGGRRR